MAAEAAHLLRQSSVGARHQFLIAAIPEIVPMAERAGDPAAGRVQCVLVHVLRRSPPNSGMQRIGRYLLGAIGISLLGLTTTMAVMRRDHKVELVITYAKSPPSAIWPLLGSPDAFLRFYAATLGRALNDPAAIEVLRSH